MAFPAIQTANQMTRTTVKKAYRATSSAGYTMARPAGTIAKKIFEISYTALTWTERNTLETYFNDHQGVEFDWTQPEGGGAPFGVEETFGVIFGEDELQFKYVAVNRWSTTFTLMEL